MVHLRVMQKSAGALLPTSAEAPQIPGCQLTLASNAPLPGRLMLMDRLLSKQGYDCSREIRVLELLKLRFGEAPLHSCEVRPE